VPCSGTWPVISSPQMLQIVLYSYCTGVGSGAGVGVGSGVGMDSGGLVGCGVLAGEGGLVGAGVAAGLGVETGGASVWVGAGCVGSGVAVGLGLGTADGVAIGAALETGVTVACGIGVDVGVAVTSVDWIGAGDPIVFGPGFCEPQADRAETSSMAASAIANFFMVIFLLCVFVPLILNGTESKITTAE